MFEPQPDHSVAYGLSARALNLPSYHDMTDDDVDRVVRAVGSSLS